MEDHHDDTQATTDGSDGHETRPSAFLEFEQRYRSIRPGGAFAGDSPERRPRFRMEVDVLGW
jgi:hypothetical protein